MHTGSKWIDNDHKINCSLKCTTACLGNEEKQWLPSCIELACTPFTWNGVQAIWIITVVNLIFFDE